MPSRILENPEGDRPRFPSRLPQVLTCLGGTRIALALLTVGLALGTPHPLQAESIESHAMPTEQTERFQPMDQPPLVKGVVTVVGLALIGLELWWFLFSRSKAE